MALTDKREMLSRECLTNLNATQASILAGYSEKFTIASGCENLTKPDIQNRIVETAAKRNEFAEFDATRRI